jgi:hypothetical protein
MVLDINELGRLYTHTHTNNLKVRRFLSLCRRHCIGNSYASIYSTTTVQYITANYCTFSTFKIRFGPDREFIETGRF